MLLHGCIRRTVVTLSLHCLLFRWDRVLTTGKSRLIILRFAFSNGFHQHLVISTRLRWRRLSVEVSLGSLAVRPTVPALSLRCR